MPMLQAGMSPRLGFGVGCALADGANWAPGGKPLVDAFHVVTVLAGQHAQLLAIPAATHTSDHLPD